MNNHNVAELKQKKLKRLLVILLVALILGLVSFILRAPYISNALKNTILPELQALSGQRVTARDIHLNLFPLYIEANGLQVSDKNNNSILITKKVKAYIELSGLLSKNLSIRRLVINEPEITTNRQKLEEIIKSVKAYLEQERKTAFKVKIKVIEVMKGNSHLRDDNLEGAISMKGFSGELIVGENQRIKTSIKELGIEKEGWPKIKCDVDTAILLKQDRVEIKRLEVGSYGSRFKSEGFYAQGRGALKTEIALIVDSVKRLFNLREKGEGLVSVKGEIRLEKEERLMPSIRTDRLAPPLKLEAGSPDILNPKNIFVDLKLNGDFYIQTLMELLKVKDKIEGLVDFKGEVTGRLPSITGRAKARLRNGNLFSVDIDSLMCDVIYKDGTMKFENGYALLYNGTAQANASINLPVVDFFALNIKFNATDSKPALKLIGWDPGIPAGKVDGELSTSGAAFNPDGWFVYKSLGSEQRMKIKGYQTPVDNALNRIKEIKGNYSLRGGILSFANLQIHTSLSNIILNGSVDIKNKALNLKGRLYAENVSDLTLPYYREAKGRGEFSGEIGGSFDNPRISGRATLTNALIEGYKSDSIAADFSYQKNLLDIRESVFGSPGEEHSMKGKISFPEAKELFDLSVPVYDLKASIKNAEFGHAVRIFYREFSGKGKMNADIKIGGKDKDIDVSGKAAIEEASVYKIPFDSASVVFAYSNKEFILKKSKVMKGKSVLTVEGKISIDKRFSFSASSEKFFIKDFGLERMPEDAVLSLQSEGHGTFDNPAITFNGKVAGGTFKGINMGGGTVSAVIQNKNISINAALFNERMKLQGNAYFSDQLPWTAELNIQPGRYDFLVSSILKDVPEDLQLNLEGRAEMKGDRNNITASAKINNLTLSLFGQTFSNDSQIQFLVNNKKLSLTAFTIKSGTTSFRLQGGMEIGKEYDIQLYGSSSLSPLKGLSKKIGYLKGDADFVFSITGKWEKPEINGGMNVSNASFGLRDYPSYISSVNGYLYIDGDRVILQRLSGKIGGGNVNLSGLVYLKAFQMKRFFLEAKLDDITAAISKDFNINFDGNLIYKGTKDAQSITGDMKVNRAKYKEMVEWRSWLLKTKAKEKPKAEASVPEKAELNVRISGSENISIDNNIARAPLSIRGDMIVKGTISNPILFGRIESKEGYVYFRNNEFRIISASIDFADPNRIKPVINLTGEALIKGYNIRLNLEGQMERFTLALSSDPHLEETDILALLTVGQVGKQLKGLEGGIGAGEATSFITGKVQDVLEERLRSITGLDRFQVEPSYSESTGTVTPKVTVSKRLIGERLFVTYSNVLGNTQEQVIKLEYLLDKNISLMGVRDEIGSIGGDVKFRFEFK